MSAWLIDKKKFSDDGLRFEYYRAPWDEEIFGVPVAQIDNFTVANAETAGSSLEVFEEWMETQDIHLCSARIPQSQVIEAAFLQGQGFKFIELNICPERSLDFSTEESSENIEIIKAQKTDWDEMIRTASQVFKVGRFHNDPALGPELGNLRYARWMQNSLDDPDQVTYRIIWEGQMVAFFVCQSDDAGVVSWQLNAMLPEFAGRGIGKQIWSKMMMHHKEAGLIKVRTSISSHNAAALNLYVSLGFRFFEPSVTLHFVRKPIKI